MKKVISIFILISLLIFGCTKKEDNLNKNIETENTEETKENIETKDKYGNEFLDDAIVISSETLQDMVVECWTRFSVGDVSFLDYIYLPKAKKDALTRVIESEGGSDLIEKLASATKISAEGIPDARFLKLDINKDGNSFVNQNSTNLTLEGNSFKYFTQGLKIKRDKPLSDTKEILDYVDKYIKNYPAKIKQEDAFDFYYVDGKPKISGDLFLNYFGVFKDLDENSNTVVDLFKNAYAEEVNGNFDKTVYEILKKGEYIEAYEYLRKANIAKNFLYDSTPVVKFLYKQDDDVRAKFLEDMRSLPNPLIKTIKTDDGVKTYIIYYYYDYYGPNASGLLSENISIINDGDNIDGFIFDDIINNTLAKEGIYYTNE